MKKHDYNKLLTRAVVIILCFFFVGGMVWGANSVLEMEGVYEPYVPAEPKSERPVTDDEIAAYLDSAIENTQGAVTAVSSSEKFRLKEDSFALTPESELTVDAIKYIHEDFEDLVENSFSKPSVAFGEEYGGILSALSLENADIESAICVSEYYRCPICGKTEDEIPEKCSECGTEETYELRYSDEYKITVVLSRVPDNVSGYFNMRSAGEIAAITADADNCLTHSEPDITYTKLYVYANVNRLTDRITHIEFNKEADAETDVTFLGDYEQLGTFTGSFSYTDSMRYDISWAGINIDKSDVTLAPEKTSVLKATLTCDDPTGYTVTWSSSDESVAGVDADGVVKAGKKDGSAVITASFEFDGVTYTDTCDVSVRVQAEKTDVSKRNAKLTVGEQLTLTATVSPKNASIRTVSWYSSDESVAQVSDSGVITAVGEGSAKVFAVSDDGHYKATCNVEVTK